MIREFVCLDCEQAFDRLFLKGNTEGTPLSECACPGGSLRFEEVVGRVAIRFKGTGFHCNDYGPPAGYSASSPSRYRMRKEIADAYKYGEIPKGQSPFDTSDPDAGKKQAHKELDKAFKSGQLKPGQNPFGPSDTRHELCKKVASRYEFQDGKVKKKSKKDQTHAK